MPYSPVAGPNVRIMPTSAPSGMPAARAITPEPRRGGFMGLMGRAYEAGIPQAMMRFGGSLMANAGPSTSPVNPWGHGLQAAAEAFEDIGERRRRQLEERRERTMEMLGGGERELPPTLTIPSEEGRVPLYYNRRTNAYERINEGEALETPYGRTDPETAAQITIMMAQDDPAMAQVYARRYEEITGRPAEELLARM